MKTAILAWLTNFDWRSASTHSKWMIWTEYVCLRSKNIQISYSVERQLCLRSAVNPGSILRLLLVHRRTMNICYGLNWSMLYRPVRLWLAHYNKALNKLWILKFYKLLVSWKEKKSYDMVNTQLIPLINKTFCYLPTSISYYAPGKILTAVESGMKADVHLHI